MLDKVFGLREVGKQVMFNEDVLHLANSISASISEKGIPYQEQEDILTNLQSFAQVVIAKSMFDTMYLLLTETQISDMFDTMRELMEIEDNVKEV
ncbi:MAG: hypothetical protein EB127_12990 [Alphaproteobacteria bacterium]|nr:hypothetical protein [Alphaproteobacteria bacterium]